MTVGIAIKCHDGIVLACDSLTTFSRGVPVKRFSNKVQLIEHDGLECPVAVIGAGMTAFFDKFIDGAKREAIADASKTLERKLDIIDFSEQVCEPLVASLFKTYAIDRNKFFGAPIGDFSLSVIVGGTTRENELRAFFLHGDGLTENIAGYGTIGSGAAYAELFLSNFVQDLSELRTDEAACLSVYAIKGVEIMDPNVGGEANVLILKMEKGKLTFKSLTDTNISTNVRDEIEGILHEMGTNLRALIAREKLDGGRCNEATA